jgi:hypothetical protein
MTTRTNAVDSKLKSALKRALLSPSTAAEAIQEVSSETIGTPGEAELVVQVLKLFPLPASNQKARVFRSALHDVVGWMQSAEGEKVTAVFKRFGAPELLRIFDDGVRSAADQDDVFLKNNLMFVLKVICMYAPAGGLERLARAARSQLLADEFLWSVVFNIVEHAGHPWQTDVIDALRDPLPQGFVRVAYIDLANAAARSGMLSNHPFDTPAGHIQLEEWLSDREEAHYSYARSAAACIPFLGADGRNRIEELAANHPGRDVQLEAAWAAAHVGKESGLMILQEACADPLQASAAMRYLRELDREDRIPVHTRSPDFQAMAEMCEWLAHPQEFGRPPQAITQVDTRELFWPPTQDTRQVWLFRYEYPPVDGETSPDIGYGMVGSVTFALFGESTAGRSVEEMYGLHCAWELETDEDPRAPEERTADAGMRILAEYNAGFSRS